MFDLKSGCVGGGGGENLVRPVVFHPAHKGFFLQIEEKTGVKQNGSGTH